MPATVSAAAGVQASCSGQRAGSGRDPGSHTGSADGARLLRFALALPSRRSSRTATVSMTAENSTLGEGDSPKPRGSPLGSRKVRAAIILVSIASLAAALWWYLRYETRGKFMQSTDNAYIAADSVIVSSKIGGYVDRVLVSENQAVRQGQALVELDAREHRAQASRISSEIEVASASAGTVRSQINEQRAAIAQAQAQLDLAAAEASFSGQQVARYEPLAATGAEPSERLAQLRTQARQTRAQVEAARAALVAAKRRVATLESQARQALAQTDAGRAQLEMVRVNLEAATLTASVNGRVGDLAVRVGQFVQPGTRLMTLVPLDQLFVEANFKETQLALMRVGQPVRIEVDALGDVELTGRVASLAPATGAQFSILPPQNATGNFTKIVQRVPVRIAIDAPAEVRSLLVPGMSVVVTADTRSAKGELEQIRRTGKER